MSLLLFPIQPYADESLMGIVARAAAENVHDTTWPILSNAGVPHVHNFDFIHSTTGLLPRLAATLGLPAEALSKLALTQRPDEESVLVSFGSIGVPKYDLIWRYRRVATAALRIAPYHRVIWNHGLLPFCSDTGELLLDHCPNCAFRLGFYRAAGIDRCERCHANLLEFPAARISRSSLKALQPLVRMLNGDDETAVQRRTLHSDIATLEPGLIFELGWRLGVVFGKANKLPRHRHKSYPVETKLAILQKGAEMLSGWPQSIQQAFDAEHQEHGVEAAEKLFKRFRYNFLSATAWPEHRDLMRRTAGSEMSAPHRARRTLLSDRGLSATEAARRLKVGDKIFANLRSHLKPTLSYGNLHQFEHYSENEIAELEKALRNRVTGARVAERLGISHHGVEQLCCAGLLTPVNDARVQETYRYLQIEGASVDQICASLSARLQPASEGDALIPLTRAMDVIGGREKPWASVFAEILSGHLTVFKGPETKRFTQLAQIRLDDLQMIANLSFCAKDFPDFPFLSTTNQRDAAEILNVLPRHATSIFRNELANAQGKGGLYQRSEVLDLARRRISGLEMKRRWFPSVSRPQFGHFDPFQRLGSSGFCRVTVEAHMARKGASL